jgi:hypothetical protein
VPKVLRAGPIGIALTAYDLYRRLPPKQRKQVRDLAFKHGPKVASHALGVYSRARKARKP